MPLSPPVVLRALGPGDGDWVIDRHAALYAAEEGYAPSFGDLVAGIVSGFLQDHDPARERGWIAWQDGRRLGSIFCRADGPRTARLRLFLLEPAARGTGLAQRMLDECLTFARAAGYQDMRLWTHESHRAACRLYARNGFAMVESTPARAFGQDVVDQIWHRML
ncbi:MAG TPA: GNAT family N-acetyltransferase [Paracoccaceae bacterium]|nr:GNAT family N-acetyltransferase [Paracoccaceae bacterium]